MRIEEFGKDLTVSVILIDASDFKTELTGIAAADVTVNYTTPAKPKVWLSKSVTGSWTELGNGVYEFMFTASEVGKIAGEFKFYCIDSTPSLPYYGSVQLTDNANYYLSKYIFARLGNSGPYGSKATDNLKQTLSILLGNLVDKLPEDLQDVAQKVLIADREKAVNDMSSKSITLKKMKRPF